LHAVSSQKKKKQQKLCFNLPLWTKPTSYGKRRDISLLGCLNLIKPPWDTKFINAINWVHATILLVCFLSQKLNWSPELALTTLELTPDCWNIEQWKFTEATIKVF
jgi:hypothetical protein